MLGSAAWLKDKCFHRDKARYCVQGPGFVEAGLLGSYLARRWLSLRLGQAFARPGRCSVNHRMWRVARVESEPGVAVAQARHHSVAPTCLLAALIEAFEIPACSVLPHIGRSIGEQLLISSSWHESNDGTQKRIISCSGTHCADHPANAAANNNRASHRRQGPASPQYASFPG